MKFNVTRLNALLKQRSNGEQDEIQPDLRKPCLIHFSASVQERQNKGF